MAVAAARDGPRWIGSLAVVLLAHATLAGALLWWPAPHRADAPAQPAQVVQVELAPLPSAPPAAPTELPPAPAQQEQRKARHRAEPVPLPAPRQPAEVALARQDVASRREDSADADVDRTSALPSVQAPPGREYAAEQSLAGARPQAQATWQSQVLGHLEKFKRYPRAAQRLRQQGTVTVRYTVDRQGNVLTVHLDASSGHEALNGEALAAMQRASPLPPPPADVPGDPVEVATPVDFTIRR